MDDRRTRPETGLDYTALVCTYFIVRRRAGPAAEEGGAEGGREGVRGKQRERILKKEQDRRRWRELAEQRERPTDRRAHSLTGSQEQEPRAEDPNSVHRSVHHHGPIRNRRIADVIRKRRDARSFS